MYTHRHHRCWKPWGREESQHEVLCERDKKEQLKDKIGKNSKWTCGQKRVGRVVYSLEGKDKGYEFDVDFQ